MRTQDSYAPFTAGYMDSISGLNFKHRKLNERKVVLISDTKYGWGKNNLDQGRLDVQNRVYFFFIFLRLCTV
jgi:hypothetical protein